MILYFIYDVCMYDMYSIYDIIFCVLYIHNTYRAEDALTIARAPPASAGSDEKFAFVTLTFDLQCIAVYCSVLQCVTVCYSVLQCVAVCCKVLKCDNSSTNCAHGYLKLKSGLL